MTEPARWFHLRNGMQEGPFDLGVMRDLVRDGTLGPDTWVWADGMPQWLPARSVPALVPPPSFGVPGWPPGATP